MARFRWFGVAIEVRTRSAELLRLLSERLPADALGSCDAGADVHYDIATALADDDEPVQAIRVQGSRDPEPELLASQRGVRETLDILLHDVEFRVAIHAPDLIFIHAAVVGSRGRAIVVPGESFSGKSTLTAALIRQGATYYSDEFAVLSRTGHVFPFARQLSLRTPDGGPGQRRSARDLGGVEGDEPIPIGAIVATRYVPNANWAPASLSRGEAILEMLQHTVDARQRPEEALRTITLAVGEGVQGWRGQRGDADLTARAILDRFGREAASRTSCSSLRA